MNLLELKINNIVKDKNRNINLCITGLQVTRDSQLNHIWASRLDVNVSGLFYPSVIQPVNLNNKWLKAFGFGYGVGFWRKDGIMIIKNKDESYSIFKSFNLICIIQYVHQFQNIYYAIKNKELILNKSEI